jgi:hypothetical protein
MGAHSGGSDLHQIFHGLFNSAVKYLIRIRPDQAVQLALA